MSKIKSRILPLLCLVFSIALLQQPAFANLSKELLEKIANLSESQVTRIMIDSETPFDDRKVIIDAYLQSHPGQASLNSLLIKAIKNKKSGFDAMKYLLEAGADLSAQYENETSKTIGEWGIEHYSERDFIKGLDYLLSKGIKYKNDILYDAVKDNKTKVALTFIKHGIDKESLYIKTKYSKTTLLHIAAKNGNPILTSKFLALGVDVNARDQNERPVIEVANKKARSVSRKISRNARSIFDSVYMQGYTGEANYFKTYKILIDKGATLPVTNHDFMLPYLNKIKSMHKMLKERKYAEFAKTNFDKTQLTEIFEEFKISSIDEALNLPSFHPVKTYFVVLENRLKNIIQGYDIWKYGLKLPGYPKVEAFPVAGEPVPLMLLKPGTEITNLVFYFDGHDIPLYVGKELDDKGKVISDEITHFYLSGYDFKSLDFSLKRPEKVKARDHMITLNNISHVFFRTGYYKESAEVIKAIIALFPEHNYAKAAISRRLAGIYYYASDFEKAEQAAFNVLYPGVKDISKAEDAMVKALNETEKASPEPIEWMAVSDLMLIYGITAQVEKAEKYAAILKKMLTLATDTSSRQNRKNLKKVPSQLIITFQNLSSILQLSGKYTEARDVLTYAKQVAKDLEGNNEQYIAQLNLSLGTLYTSSGQFESAKSIFNETLESLKSGTIDNGGIIAEAYHNIGLIYGLEGKFALAEKNLVKALELRVNTWGKDHTNYAFGENVLGGLYRKQKKHEQSRQYLTRAEKKLNTNKSVYRYLPLLELSLLELDLNNPTKARSYFDLAEEIAINSFGKKHKHYAYVLSVKAKIENKLGNNKKSIENWLNVIEILEKERGQFTNDYDRRNYLKTVTEYYNGLIEVALESNDLPLVIKTIERLKSKTLLELLANKNLQIKDKSLKDLVTKINQLDKQKKLLSEDTQKNIKMKTDMQRGLDIEAPANQDKKASQIASIDNDKHKALQKLRKLNLGFSQIMSVNPVDIQLLQASLDKNTALVMFHELEQEDKDNKLIAIAISNNKIIHGLIPAIDKLYQDTDTLISLLKTSSSSLDKIKTTSSAIYNTLLKPVETNLTGIRKLIVVPHGKLNFIPFNALYDGKQFLAEKFQVTNSPSASIYQLLTKRKPNSLNSLVAMGDPESRHGRLAGAQQEVKDISKLFQNKNTYIGEKATESLLKTLEQSPSILHIASHGVFNPDAPERSYLSLSKDEKNDGDLEAYEAYSLKLNSTRLVVLSACETATGKVSGGNEVMSLIRPFIYSGAQNVVASLWKVDDLATKNLMTNFYDNLLNKNKPEAEALQLAQLSLLHNPDTQHPYYWAAFQVHGSAQHH